MPSPDRPRGFGATLATEVGAVGLAVRRETLLAATVLAIMCFMLSRAAIRFGDRLAFVPELLLPGLLVALVLPWIVWKGDPPFGRAYLWTLPVRRQQAAAAKIMAGALWLMLAMLIGFVMLSATALSTGGSIGLSEVRLVAPRAADLAAAARIPWTTPLWMWGVPFCAALAAYAASSAVLLGLRYPLRWIGAVALAVALVGMLAANLGPHNALEDAIDHFAKLMIEGRFGLDFALSGGTSSLSREIHTTGPGSTNFWIALPTAGRWAAALLVWFGGALLALALALRRHWER